MYLQPKCFSLPCVLHPWPGQRKCGQLTAGDLLTAQLLPWVRTQDVNAWKAKENTRKKKISYAISRWTIHFMVSASIPKLSPRVCQSIAVILQRFIWQYLGTDVTSISTAKLLAKSQGWFFSLAIENMETHPLS